MSSLIARIWGPSLTAFIRKTIKKRKLFPTDDATRKVSYLAIQDASKEVDYVD